MLLRDIYHHPKMTMGDIGFRRIPESLLQDFGLDMDPDYQRDHVWTVEQRAKYIGFLLQGGKGLPIIVNLPKGFGGATSEIVDGKQRITSICKFLDGEFDAELYDGRRVSASELLSSPECNRMLSTSIMVRIGYVEMDRAGVIDYYLRLNNGGTVHTNEEIQRVRELLKEES